MKHTKRWIALLLSAVLAGGSVAALAAEEITVQTQPTTLTATVDMQTTTAARAQNDIIIPSSSKNQKARFGDTITLDFTVKHPKGAPEGRAVVLVGHNNYVTKKITSKSNSSFTFHAAVQDERNSMENPYDAGTYLVQAYTEVKEDDRWVRASEIKTTNLYVVPTAKVYPINHETYPTLEGITFSFIFYDNGDDEDSNYPEEYYQSIVYRKAPGETQWTQIPHESWTSTRLVNRFCTDTDVKNGQKYTYSVKTCINGDWSKRSDSVSYYFLHRPKGLAARDSSTGKTMYLSWNQNSKASGYEVRYMLEYKPHHVPHYDKCKTRTLSGNQTTTLKLKNRTPGKQYWFQVRSYKTVDGETYYSDWSKVSVRYPEQTDDTTSS